MRRTAMIDVSIVATCQAWSRSPFAPAKQGGVADAVQAEVGASATTLK